MLDSTSGAPDLSSLANSTPAILAQSVLAYGLNRLVPGLGVRVQSADEERRCQAVRGSGATRCFSEASTPRYGGAITVISAFFALISSLLNLIGASGIVTLS